MARALFIIDVQNDFTEGGSLAVAGGSAVAAGITSLLNDFPDRYDVVIASRDWHDGDNDNGGHFSETPDFVDSWPEHCVAGTDGAEYHPALDAALVDIHVRKGQGRPAYSTFEGTTDDGRTVTTVLNALDIDEIDVVGLATDHCVRASALDALSAGRRVRVLTEYTAGVAPESTERALDELKAAGAQIVR